MKLAHGGKKIFLYLKKDEKNDVKRDWEGHKNSLNEI